MNRRLGWLAAALVLVAAILWLRPKPVSDEAQIRALVARCVAAAEKHDLGTIADAMAEDFVGPHSATKREVKQVLLMHLFRNTNALVVFNPSLEVRVTGSSASFAGTFVFARSKEVNWKQPGDGVSRYDIEGTLVRTEGEWKFATAEWK